MYVHAALRHAQADPAGSVLAFAFRVQETMAGVRRYCAAHDFPEVHVRIGVAAGTAITGMCARVYAGGLAMVSRDRLCDDERVWRGGLE